MIWRHSTRLNIFCYCTALRKAGMVIVITLGGCAGFEIEDHSLQYNQAVGSLGNRLLLLNAVRAAQDYPMQFSKLASYTGQGREKGSLEIEIPFGVNKVGAGPLSPDLLTGTLKPTVELNSGVNSFQLVDLNTAEAQRALRTQPGTAEYEYYLTQGWPSRLVTTIMIEMIAVEEELVDILSAQYVKVCGAGKVRQGCAMYEPYKVCERETNVPGEGIIKLASTPYAYKGGKFVTFFNRPTDRCRFIGFQVLFDAFHVSGGGFDLLRAVDEDADTPESEGRGKAGPNYTVDVNVNVAEVNKPKAKPKRGIPVQFENTGVQNKYGSILKRLEQVISSPKGEKTIKHGAFELVFRSPERMVRFLGEIVAVQNFIKTHVVKVSIDEDRVTLFDVRRGSEFGGEVAVSVEGPDGNRFVIPTPEYGSAKRDRSLQSLAFVMDFLNSAVSGKSLPAPNTIILTGGN